MVTSTEGWEGQDVAPAQTPDSLFKFKVTVSGGFIQLSEVPPHPPPPHYPLTSCFFFFKDGNYRKTLPLAKSRVGPMLL